MKARRSDEAGFCAIGGQVGQYHVAVTATLTVLAKAIVVIEERRKRGKEKQRVEKLNSQVSKQVILSV